MPTDNESVVQPVVAPVVVVQPVVAPVPAVDPPAQPFADLAAANAEIVKLRAESGTRRVTNVELNKQIADLQKQVPTADIQAQITQLQGEVQRFQAAGEAGVSPELLRASDELRNAKTADEMKAATEKITRLTAAGTAAKPPNPTPPKVPTAPLSLDEQITAAEASKNVRESMRLKTQKLTEQK